jgi:hypothetical protein
MMSLDPNTEHYQAGATAYLIDPGGTYSLAGASAPTIDPAGTHSAPGVSAPALAATGAYIPIAGATSAAAEIVDPAGADSLAGASAPTTDPAGPYSGAGANAPTPADPTYIPGAGTTAAEVALIGAYSPAGANAPTTDPARRYSTAGANAPTPASPTYIPGPGATSSAAELVDPAGTYSGPGASAPALTAAGAYIPVTGATPSAAEIVDPAGAYSLAGASAPTIDPASRYSAAGTGAPTLAAPDASIPVTGAAYAAAKSPPGTYLPPGATAPIADPAGTYSAAGASAPTTDPAGTYSSPYALNRLIVLYESNTPATAVLSFNSVAAVENYYGVTSSEATLAKEFFAGYAGTSATLSFTRFGLGQRPHLLGANISNLTLAQLQSINGSLALTFDGYTYSGKVNLSGVTSFQAAAKAIQATLNSSLQVEAVTAGSAIAPESASFTGYADKDQLYITSVSSGSIQIGGIISGDGVKSAQIINQLSGTPGGPGQYATFTSPGTISSETMTETYGVLTVGAVNSGTVAVGEQVTGAGVLPLTAIDGNLSGSGPGSTWIVNNAQTVAGENMAMRMPFLQVHGQTTIGATENDDSFNISPNGDFGFDQNPSSLSYVSGTAAAALGLTQTSGAIDSSPGGQHPTTAQFMNDVVQNEYGQFGSFETNIPRASPALEAWAQSTGYRFIPIVGAKSTPPAGASRPTVDLAGTYSGSGASAPTPAAPGTYIPVPGATSSAAEIVDPAGFYSLAGASAPTLAQPGYYVPTSGASYETPDEAGYYTPYPGATAERPVQAPVISGTVAGQSTPSGQPDTPFSFVTIKDPNKLTSDSLSIELTGGGGTLAGSGLAESAPGVYLLSGSAAAITSELDALVFTPNTFGATTTFTLTDTTSRGTSATNANTTVTVTNGTPVVASVSRFLAQKSKLDKTPGGFDILDGTPSISANLDQLNDSHIDEIVDSDNGNVVASVQQLTTDKMAIKKLQNANHSPARLAIQDTAADVQAGLSTLVAHTGEIASITASNGPIVVSAATFLTDQSTLDKIVGGFDVSDTAANITANLDQLDDPNVSTITISDNGQISASVAQLTADATAIGDLRDANGSPVLLAINDTAGAVQTGLSTLVQDTGEIRSITTSYGPIVVSVATFLADQSTLDKIVGGFDVSDTAANLVAALPTLNADPGVDGITADIGDATLSGGVGVNAPNFSETGWATGLTLDENLDYAGSFSEGAGATFVLSGGHLLLSGAATFAGGTVGGSHFLYTVGTTTVSGLTIGGTVEWVNTRSVTQNGGTVTIGDASGDQAILDNELLGTYDITDDSGIGRGSSTASDIKNAGLFEKTGGTGVSTIVPSLTNMGKIDVSSGTLDFGAGISGTGSDTISGAATLEFDAKVASSQTVNFTGVGGELALHKPVEFAGDISGFDTAGAGSSDTIEVARPWVFSGFTENAGGTQGTLNFANGASALSLTLIGDYKPADFVHQTQANGSTLITYDGVSGLDSSRRPVSGAGGYASEFGFRGEATGSADLGAGAGWDGTTGHGPGPSG